MFKRPAHDKEVKKFIIKIELNLDKIKKKLQYCQLYLMFDVSNEGGKVS